MQGTAEGSFGGQVGSFGASQLSTFYMDAKMIDLFPCFLDMLAYAVRSFKSGMIPV